MRPVEIRAAEPADDVVVARVATTFGNCLTLADVLAWTSRQSPRVHVAEIVTQDEYTHDVVLPYGSVFLSFDTT